MSDVLVTRLHWEPFLSLLGYKNDLVIKISDFDVHAFSHLSFSKNFPPSHFFCTPLMHVKTNQLQFQKTKKKSYFRMKFMPNYFLPLLFNSKQSTSLLESNIFLLWKLSSLLVHSEGKFFVWVFLHTMQFLLSEIRDQFKSSLRTLRVQHS